LMAGIAFITFVARSFISGGMPPVFVGILIIPWAVGSLVGIRITTKRDQSTLLGATLGGALGTLVCPVSIILYRYGLEHLFDMCRYLAIAACMGGLLGAIIGVVREGITTSRRP
jgi:hypothetical protein